MKYIANTTQGHVTFFVNNRPVRFDKSDEKYVRAIALFNLPADEQEEALERLVSGSVLPNSIKEAVQEGFVIVGDSVSYQDERLPQVLANKVLALIAENLPVDSFVKFWANLRQNLSYTAIIELYDFLSYKALPITEDGCFLAYKGVDFNYYSVTGNVETRVLQGETDNGGHIYNKIGTRIEVDRRDVCDDRTRGCAPGLHAGSLDYARGWGAKTLIVKINPKDVVSIPSDCAYQKLRCSAYEVVAEFVEEILAPVVNSELQPVVSEELVEAKAEETKATETAKANHQDLKERVQRYIAKKVNDGYYKITVRQIQNSFSPNYPSQTHILDIVTDLGYIFIMNGNSYEISINNEEW